MGVSVVPGMGMPIVSALTKQRTTFQSFDGVDDRIMCE